MVGGAQGADGRNHAIVWRNGVAVDLGAAPGGGGYEGTRATAISPNGLFIVGTTVEGTPWVHTNNTLYDIESVLDSTIGLSLGIPVAVNDFGQILIGGSSAPGELSLRLDLVSNTPDVPEPATFALVAAGLVLASVRRRASLLSYTMAWWKQPPLQ